MGIPPLPTYDSKRAGSDAVAEASAPTSLRPPGSGCFWVTLYANEFVPPFPLFSSLLFIFGLLLFAVE